ncbi:MAG: DUF3634 family protein [Deltaproteobacteria bacterium]|nr:DUF3634 family protein [Deltaproteobacteria bacterium]
MIRLVFIVAAIGLLVWLFRWLYSYSHALFEIRVRQDGVRLRGQVPGRRAPDILEFVTSLRLPAGSRVRGLPDGHRFRLQFSEQVPPGLQQRIRNYLFLKG